MSTAARLVRRCLPIVACCVLAQCHVAGSTGPSGPAVALVFSVPPSTSVAAKKISPIVRVEAKDAQGNTSVAYTGLVTIGLTPGTGSNGAILGGALQVAAVGGLATFPDLSVNKVGTGYTLTASASTLGAVTSSAFDVTPGSAQQLAFTVQPSQTVSLDTMIPAVRVAALDAGGNTATGFIGNVSVVITGGTGAVGAKLNGFRTEGAVAGIATFSSLNIDKAATGYTLTATASGVSGTVSAPFTITAANGVRLAFTVDPSAATAGATITPTVQVSALDSAGNLDPTFTGMVTVAIAPGTGRPGATLSGSKTAAAIAGVASFAGLSIDSAGTGYRLTATATGQTAATSATFDITAGTATRLAFDVQPSTQPSGHVIAPNVRVAAQDAYGNTDLSFAGSVTVAIGHNPAGGTLAGTLTVAAFAGLATFNTLSIDKAGVGYTLTAAATGMTPATSVAFDITGGSATQLMFTIQPSKTTATAVITPAVEVTARDSVGNAASGFTGNVTVTITPGTGTAGATLGGTRTVPAISGVATFSSLSVDKVGTGYTLSATSGNLTTAVSLPFNITVGAASQLVFTMEPTATTAGTAISPAVQVTALDAGGNIATGFTGTVTMAFGTNPAGGTLSGTKAVSAVAGVASFSNLSVNLSASGYTLAASASGLTGAASTAFTVTPGKATGLAFSVQPSSALAGATMAPAVQVTALDAFGNTATGFTGTVTVSISAGTGAAGATLGGTLSQAAAAGLASFADLSINLSGTGYTLTASAAGVSSATSASFNIN